MAPPPPGPTRGPDLLLDGLALLICEGYPAGAPVLRRAVSAFRGTDLSTEEGLRWLWLASYAAGIVWDYASWDVLSDRQVRLARDAGALIALPIALSMRATVHLFAGEFTEAASLVAQAESVAEATGSSFTPYGALALAVFRGQEAQAAHLIQVATDDAGRRGEGAGLSAVQWAAAVLGNSLGRYEEALAAAQRASEDTPAVRFASGALVELVEAAVRSAVPSARPAPSSGSPASPAPARPTGRLAPRPARGRWSATASMRKASTARRSTASAVPGCGWTWPAPACSTASGCAASGADVTPATSSAPRTRSSTRPAPQRSPNGPASSCGQWRPGPRTHRRDARYPYRARSADRPPGRRRRLQPADRRAAVHQPRHRRLPPAQGLHQARHQLTQPACSRASRPARRSTAGRAAGLIPAQAMAAAAARRPADHRLAVVTGCPAAAGVRGPQPPAARLGRPGLRPGCGRGARSSWTRPG